MTQSTSKLRNPPAVRGVSRPGGFSLIELMMVVVLVGVLAAIAIPSYNAYVVRGQRSAAKAALLQAAQFLERNYTANGCYNFSNPQGCQNAAGGTALSLPSAFGFAPTDGGPATYTIALSFTNAASAVQDFTLTATPCAESGTCPAGGNTTFDDTACGALTLNNAGAKTVSGTSPPDQCWQH